MHNNSECNYLEASWTGVENGLMLAQAENTGYVNNRRDPLECEAKETHRKLTLEYTDFPNEV